MKLTLEQVKAMSDDELRSKVAELCGWKPYRFGGCKGDAHEASPPNYCRDLNAMHEAEKSIITQDQYIPDYTEALYDTARHDWHATARQRAEAFVLTMGK